MEIGVWGDSIAYGEGDNGGLGWVGRLRNSYSSEEDTRVYNRGICGDTSEGLLKRFAIEADSIYPDLVIFAIGINDSKFPHNTNKHFIPLEAFTDNVCKLIEQAKIRTSKIYMVGLTKVDESAEWGSGSRFENNSIQNYNTALKKFCDSEQLNFIEVFDVLEATDLEDGLHPKADGYQKMFDVIRPFIKNEY